MISVSWLYMGQLGPGKTWSMNYPSQKPILINFIVRWEADPCTNLRFSPIFALNNNVLKLGRLSQVNFVTFKGHFFFNDHSRVILLLSMHIIFSFTIFGTVSNFQEGNWILCSDLHHIEPRSCLKLNLPIWHLELNIDGSFRAISGVLMLVGFLNLNEW